MSLENSFGQRFLVRIISGDYNEFASVSRHAQSLYCLMAKVLHNDLMYW